MTFIWIYVLGLIVLFSIFVSGIGAKLIVFIFIKGNVVFVILCCLILLGVRFRGCIMRILINSLIFYPSFSRNLPIVSHIVVSILTVHPSLISPSFSSTLLLNSTTHTSHTASASTCCLNSAVL